ncbi:glycosyltransferase family 92 protein Os08g0121900 [Rutidosis leptorrhynchoides]|uniref:glycosyltransferase family 92 protein Os08g0121900 n=1 Tax=Rutidosis leptorrhynchoides TaxID=125765 RepID=UPI003A997601
MALKIRTLFLYVSISVVSFAAIYHLLSPNRKFSSNSLQLNHQQTPQIPHISNTIVVNLIDNYSTSILFPAWEVIVIVSSENKFDKNNTNYSSNHFCLFDTIETSPARFSGALTYPDRKTYTCLLPKRVRRRLPFRQPLLTDSTDHSPVTTPASELLRWNFIVYEIYKTENDVVLFAKGINNRQGVNRSPTEFKCVFGDDIVNGVTTSVKSSLQEVFRCEQPELTAFSQTPVKASLLVVKTNQMVPSIAYYYNNTSRGTVAISNCNAKSLLCACTMVFNVAKFLKEWVIYHSKIGVDKFILYDNGSDDNLQSVVDLLKSRGYDIETRFWLWPKTQEAGFSHAALHLKNSCKWVMYIDVDEFVYSPQWANTQLSRLLLPSLLPKYPYGQLTIRCYEFGPSKQKKHPSMGVTQGYNCKKRLENRHKSIVYLDAIDESSLNVIHHFKMKDGYKSKKMGLEKMVVNHYKYQAWPEFKAKFRRRVSAYVVDWTRSENLKSNDRAPGLGHLAVEPKGWEGKFCEVYDNRLKNLTRRWFGLRNGQSGFLMEWQN